MPALDLVMVPEKYEPLCREDFRRQGILEKIRDEDTILCLFLFDEEHYPPRRIHLLRNQLERTVRGWRKNSAQ